MSSVVNVKGARAQRQPERSGPDTQSEAQGGQAAQWRWLRRWSWSVAPALVAVVLSGCSLSPPLELPEVAMTTAYKGAPIESSQWIEIGATQLGEPARLRGDWWTHFNDPQLNRLVQQLNQENQQVAQALARYQRAQATLDRVASDQLPTVSGDLGMMRRGASNQGPSARYTAGAAVAWEVDLWGRVRDQVASARYSQTAAAADLADMRLSMQAELLRHYFGLRTVDRELAHLSDILTAYERALTVTQHRYHQGVAAYADVVQAQAQLAQAQANRIGRESVRQQHENAIAVLVGQNPSAFHIAPLTTYSPAPIAVPVGLPTTLLTTRPDVVAAAQRIAAANAEIGVARSTWLPRLNVNASGDLQSSHLSDLLTAPLNVWSLGPSLLMTILDGGARRAGVAAAQADYQLQVAQFRQTVLEALREVEDALIREVNLERELMAQGRALTAAHQSLRITENQYQAGLVDYLSVVQAQNTAYNAQIRHLHLQGQRLENQVQLIRALGGGWLAQSGAALSAEAVVIESKGATQSQAKAAATVATTSSVE